MTSSRRKLGQPKLLRDDDLQDCGVPVPGEVRGFEGPVANDPGCQGDAETPESTPAVAVVGGSRGRTAAERYRARLRVYRERESRVPRVDHAALLRSRWFKMHSRCHNPGDKGYADYGGRGIHVHPAWQWPDGLKAFAAHMGPCPSPAHTVGRVDNDKGYEPGNVRWETWAEQQNNRRSSVRVSVGDKTLTLAQWAAATGITRQLIQTRKGDGWAMEVAVSTPAGVKKAEAHRAAGIEPAGPWTPRPRKRKATP